MGRRRRYEAASGAEALAALAQPYDLVLMDYQLPDSDGPSVTRELRRRRPGGEPPVVALTGSTLAADRQACAEAGMDDFLSKPAGLDGLRRILHRWTGRRAPRPNTYGWPDPPAAPGAPR